MAGERMGRLRSIFVATWVALALIAGSVFAPTAQAQEMTISRIDVEGLQRIEEATIRSYLQLQEGDAVTAAGLNEAFKRLFDTGLFEDIEIAPQEGGVLVVTVIENPIIDQIAFEGNRRIDDEVLAAQIRSRPRTAFTRARAEADALIVLEAYRAAGRFSATVEPKIIRKEGNRVDLVFEISEGETVGVSAINFVGNSEYSDRRLRGVIETTESAWWRILANSDNYDPDRLEFDKELLRRFYFSRGYADFEVVSALAELNPERNGFFITFTIVEGRQYDVGEVTVVSTAEGVEAGPFEELVKTDTGDTYDADRVQETVRDMQRFAGQTGINFIDIEPRAERRENEAGEPIIDLEYRIVETPRRYVERIEIEGNVRTLDKVIRREFEFVEGDAFNAYRLQQSRQNIQALRFFQSVDIDTERGSADDKIVVTTRVQEQSTGDLTFGLGFSSVDSVGGQVSITERNFLGRGQLVRASVSATTARQFFDFRFVEPYFLERDVRAGFDIFHREIDNQDESSFDRRETGFRPNVNFPLSDNSRIGLEYLFELSDIREVPNDASPIIAGEIDANGDFISDGERGSRIVSSLGLTYTLDERNSRIQPTEGFVLRFRQQVAGLGGDASFSRTTASVKGFTSFFREEVVASLEIEGGAIVGFGSDDLRTSDRFQLGGDSFRGFRASGLGPRDVGNNGGSIVFRNESDDIDDGEGEFETEGVDDALGGNYFAIARADLSFPIGLPEEYGVFGGLFADVGSVWGLDNDNYLAFTEVDNGGDTIVESSQRRIGIDDDFALRATVGASIFWSSPVGPVKFNFATPLLEQDDDKTEFFRFSAGTRF